jgi:formylglycine-generating enzyme required for sulfatase activity
VDAADGEANGFGLRNVCGNVWEWCDGRGDGRGDGPGDGPGGRPDDGTRPLRGGSFLCHDSFCNRYRVAARTANTASSSASNIGFRVAAGRQSSR